MSIKICMGERVRECQEADFGYFEALGFAKVEAPKAKKAKKATAKTQEIRID